MENTLKAARADDGTRRETHGVELTPAGRLLVAAAIAVAAFGGWRGYQHDWAADASVAPLRANVRTHAASAAATAATTASGAASVVQLTQALQQERSERSAQAAAWRSIADADRQQIAALAAQLQSIESKIGALEKAPQTARATREAVLADAASGVRALRPAIEAARSVARLDVASLPVETVSAQSLNLTAFENGAIQLGNQRLSVGQAIQPGETLVAVDPVSRSIVTNRRILNVTN